MVSRQIFSAFTQRLKLSAKSVKCTPSGFNTNYACNYFSTSLAKKKIFTIKNEEEFKNKVMAEGPVPTVVDFSATWSISCKLLALRLSAAIAATEGQVNLAIVDVDIFSDLALQFFVKSIPTILAVNNGWVVDRFIGDSIDDDELKKFVNDLKVINWMTNNSNKLK